MTTGRNYNRVAVRSDKDERAPFEVCHTKCKRRAGFLDKHIVLSPYLPSIRWLLPCRQVLPCRCDIYVCRCADTSSFGQQGRWPRPEMSGTAWWPSFSPLWQTSPSAAPNGVKRQESKNIKRTHTVPFQRYQRTASSEIVMQGFA